jgi:two-component system NtrC family sensor kinase
MQDHQKPQSTEPEQANEAVKSDTADSPLSFGPFGKSIMQSLPVGVVVFDSELRVVEANAQAEKLIDLGDYVDKSLASAAHGSDLAESGWTEQLKSAISADRGRRFDPASYVSNGKTRLLQLVCIPLREGKTQTSLGGCILIEDITERVDIHKQLANAERLATVGKLTSKVAHELNDLMDGIMRYINLATRLADQGSSDKPKEYLVRCRQGLTRMVQIVSELLEFSRSSHIPLEYARLEQIIEDAISAMEDKVRSSNIHILRDYAHGLPQIKSDNLFQVFCNIIKNAFDAMPDGGELHISTRLASDNMAVAEFRDTGAGFAPEHADAIFEPFFTTKQEGKGTGLGLAICRDILEKYRGRVTAANAPQGGSIFTVYLPLTDSV